MLLNLPTRSLEAFAEAQEGDSTRHQRLAHLHRGTAQIPQMLKTTANYNDERGRVRAALARMHTTHREAQNGKDNPGADSTGSRSHSEDDREDGV